jgi:peptide/nickel transport system permease protein
LGASHRRIILQNLLPNVLPTVIVAATVSLGGAILAEAALSFLGLGAPPTQPSWGQMLSSDARRYMQTAPWLAIFPGLFLSLTVLGVNLLGDALRDVLDPRMRGT